ncbi:MAG: MFS transporter [Clostridia bacterium]|nr:MFS transporter [Clostridia bacterium]
MKPSVFAKKITWIFAFIYFASYITRINFAAVMVEIVNQTGHSNEAISLILVGMSISYGVGQIINGWIGDKVKPQNLILCGCLISTLINFVFPLSSHSVPIMTALWTVNGFAQAMIWPPIVKILVASPLSETEYGYSVVRITSASAICAIVVYAVSPWMIQALNWEAVFIVCAIIGLSATVFWLFIKEKIIASASFEVEQTSDNLVPTPFKFPKEAIFPMIFVFITVFLQGMVRDGVTSWSPSYLEGVFGMAPEDSISGSLPLAIFSALAIFVAGWVYKRFFKNEIACAVFLYSFVLVFSLGLYLFFDAGAVVAVVCMTVLTCAVQGVNLMLITHVPKRFKKYGNISTISGLINAFVYLGSALASYGVAALVAAGGWRFTALVLCIVVTIGMTCCIIAAKGWKKFIDKDNS